MEYPLLSFVIVTFNAAGTVCEAIDSILNQSYPNKEIVIIDGLSNDNTVEKITAYGNKINYFISEKDSGIYDAMNKGIAASRGEWVLFLGADDTLYNPGVCMKIFEESAFANADLIYGDALYSSKQVRYGGEKDYGKLIESNICHQAIFYKRGLLEKMGRYNLRYAILADYELNLRIFRNDALTKKYVPQIVTLFNDKGTSNVVLDRYFHSDMLQFFLKQDKINYWNSLLQQYHFYYGYISFYNKEYFKGLKHIVTSWFNGKRKLFFFLLTGKFSLLLLTKKGIKIK